ncbi:MAG: hypothetical protein XD52_0724 [bacterium 42_11]|nr:MAG: hypothetical protein XD52_0724 [bacterium 42_11]
MRKKLLYLLVALGCLFLLWGCGGGGEESWIPSNYFALVVGVDSSYQSGNLSTLDLSDESFAVQKSVVSNLSGDTIVKTFKNYAFIVERPSWGTEPSPVKSYDIATGTWENPLKEYSLGRNVYDIAFVDENTAYAIPWGESYIQKINPITGDETKKIDLSSYSYGQDGSPNAAKGLVVGGKLFVILQRFDAETFDYATGTVVVIDLNSDEISRSVTLSGKNPNDIDYYQGKFYIVESGKLYDPSDDFIEVITPSNYDVQVKSVAPLQEEGMDVYSLEITEEGKAYLLGGGWPSYKVFEYDISTGEVGNSIYTGGYITAIKYDPYSGYLFILDRGSGEGNGKVVIYDTHSNEILREISEEEIGYPPYSIDILASN